MFLKKGDIFADKQNVLRCLNAYRIDAIVHFCSGIACRSKYLGSAEFVQTNFVVQVLSSSAKEIASIDFFQVSTDEGLRVAR